MQETQTQPNTQAQPPESKACSKCKETKPLEEFAKKNGGKWGRDPLCKVCKQAYWRELSARKKSAAAAARQAPGGEPGAQDSVVRENRTTGKQAPKEEPAASPAKAQPVPQKRPEQAEPAPAPIATDAASALRDRLSIPCRSVEDLTHLKMQCLKLAHEIDIFERVAAMMER